MATKKIATRDGFGEAIVEVGKENPNVIVLDIDIGKSCKTAAFHKELPDQYLNVGIAEQNGAGGSGQADVGDSVRGERRAATYGILKYGRFPAIAPFPVYGFVVALPDFDHFVATRQGRRFGRRVRRDGRQ